MAFDRGRPDRKRPRDDSLAGPPSVRRIEKGFSGQAVQKVHMRLGKEKRPWPRLTLPPTRGALTPADVLAAPEGAERDTAIDTWCASVWAAFEESRPAVVALLREHGFS